MANTIKLKNSSVALKVPLTTDLVYGEVALNYADGKIYYKKSDGTIQSISGGGGGVWTKITTTTTAVAGKQYLVDTTAGAFTVTLPNTPAPVAGDYIYFMDVGNWVTNNLTIERNGYTIEGVADDVLFNLKGVLVQLIYDGSTWQLTCNIGPQGAQGPAGTSYALNSALGTPVSGVLTNTTGLPLTTGTTGILPVAKGGTGTATPGLVQGTNVTITGTWPNQTITAASGGGGGGTTTNALTAGTGLVLNSGTTFDGSAAKTISLAAAAGNTGTFGNSYVDGTYIYMPQLTVDTYGRVTSISTNYISVGGTTLPSQYGNAGKYLTTNGTTLSWAAVAAGGGSGWYSMVATSMGTTSLPLPSDYDGSGSNMANPKLFVGGEDQYSSSGNSPSGGMWNTNTVSGSFNIYTHADYTPQSGAISINTSSSSGVRFAIAPKATSMQMATVFYTPSSYYNAVFNLNNGWSGPQSYQSSKVWYGIVVLDSANVIAAAVNCTILETKSSSYKTYIAISMTDAQCSTVSNTYADVCAFNGTYTFRVFGFYRYG